MEPTLDEAKHRQQATIRDFGEQWTRYQENEGYYGSLALFQDIVGPLVQPEELRGARVADVGSGTGRIVNMLLDAGVASVIALEPSAAYDVLVKNTADRAQAIEYIRATGDQLPTDRALDLVFSIGVIHHIADPRPVLRAMHEALRPGGSAVVWVYGYEGNELYVRLVRVLRSITTWMPDAVLSGLAWVLCYALEPYVALARICRVPMGSYFVNHYARLPRKSKQVTLFDQLNPCVARYYREAEIRGLMEEAGFAEVRLYHRHGYSWTVRGTRGR